MNTDILIVGAGFAGASTAYHLSRDFSGSILVIDKEEIPGFHASGRNASLVLQGTQNPHIRRVIAASRKAYSQQHNVLNYQQHGSFLLGSRNTLEQVRDPGLIVSQYCTPEDAVREIPLLKGHHFEAALWTSSDGVMDISALLQFYLTEAAKQGVKMRLNCELLDIEATGPYRLRTSQGTIEAKCIVNAAGAWASEVARMAGGSELPAVPFKRHLFVLDDLGKVEPTWPFVWNLEQSFYFRPESGGLLFSICDDERTKSLEPTVSPEISEALAEFVWLQLPAVREAVQRDVWSCFRTKAPDDSFLIGRDPVAEDLFWIAALGGHGMGASWEVGRLAARLITDPSANEENPFNPARLLGCQTSKI